MRRWLVRGLALLSLVILGTILLGTRSPINAQQTSAIVSSSVIAGGFGSPNIDETPSRTIVYLPAPRSTLAKQKTMLKLQEKVSVNFLENSTLHDLKSYLEKTTVDKTDFPDGLSIYFEPEGLQDADKTMRSTIALQLKNIPLETALRLLLRQVSLTFWVNSDGLVIVTYSSSESPILSQADVDQEILSNLSLLRSEVKSLREEIRSARGGQGGSSLTEPAVGIPKTRPMTQFR